MPSEPSEENQIWGCYQGQRPMVLCPQHLPWQVLLQHTFITHSQRWHWGVLGEGDIRFSSSQGGKQCNDWKGLWNGCRNAMLLVWSVPLTDSKQCQHVGSGVSQLAQFLTVCPWANYLTFLIPNFLLYKIRIIIILIVTVESCYVSVCSHVNRWRNVLHGSYELPGGYKGVSVSVEWKNVGKWAELIEAHTEGKTWRWTQTFSCHV